MEKSCIDKSNMVEYFYREGWTPETGWIYTLINKETGRKMTLSKMSFISFYEVIE